ncbi:MAG TPA: hypothetical protein DCZ94_10755 [Lentisphaeria bacterium]|nr:MAG: hypothetical protein A2X48_06635 [Lentisphaerae bacterium GWF2_49_21]HBC87424.1 hypothetical protein [Lentisphaeria bacterium]
MKKRAILTAASCLGLLLAGLAITVLSVDYHNRMVKEMEHATPFYIKRTSSQWDKQGRILGELRNTPAAFTIDICAPANADKTLNDKPLKTITPNVNLTVYDTGWIAAGTYDIIYKSQGYVDHRVPNVKISSYSDCVINIYFGQIEYRR